MSILVYWREPPNPDDFFPNMRTPCAREFKMSEMSEALLFVNEQRKAGNSHVCISGENPNSIGKPGVDSVENGKTPDGHAYEWSKQHRAGSTRRR